MVLRCQEKQMLKLVDVIKTALNEVGCEELPSGCDDISVEQSFIENNINHNDQPVSEIPFNFDSKHKKKYFYFHLFSFAKPKQTTVISGTTFNRLSYTKKR